LEKFLDGWWVQGLMSVVTLYSLFGSDINNLAFGVDVDPIFWTMSAIALALFSLEIILACGAKEGYLGNFYFWLDLISTVSLITDIGWIMNAMLGISSSGGGQNAKQAAQYAKASQGTRIGTRAGRVARVIRLIRLIRIVKLYKTANHALSKRAKLMEDNEFDAEI
jgi:Ion transport protein